jgi:ankyrin repeat protein
VAAGAGDLEIAKLLLTIPGIDANLYDMTHATPFCLAARYKHLEVLEEITAFLGVRLSDTLWQLQSAPPPNFEIPILRNCQ